jgi:hypothetical protein
MIFRQKVAGIRKIQRIRANLGCGEEQTESEFPNKIDEEKSSTMMRLRG